MLGLDALLVHERLERRAALLGAGVQLFQSDALQSLAEDLVDSEPG